MKKRPFQTLPSKHLPNHKVTYRERASFTYSILRNKIFQSAKGRKKSLKSNKNQYDLSLPPYQNKSRITGGKTVNSATEVNLQDDRARGHNSCCQGFNKRVKCPLKKKS